MKISSSVNSNYQHILLTNFRISIINGKSVDKIHHLIKIFIIDNFFFVGKILKNIGKIGVKVPTLDLTIS